VGFGEPWVAHRILDIVDRLEGGDISMSEILPMPEGKYLDVPWGYQLIVDCFGCD
jgi:hypothetical protein